MAKSRKSKTFMDHIQEKPEDVVFKKYAKPTTITTAQQMLAQEGLTEEMVLGARGVLLLNGLL